MIDKYRLDDLRLESGEKGELARWVIQLQIDLDNEHRNVVALEAAEKRIAELEARVVNLPKRSVGEVMHMSGFTRDYAEGWCSGNDNAIHAIRAAGIGVKGE